MDNFDLIRDNEMFGGDSEYFTGGCGCDGGEDEKTGGGIDTMPFTILGPFVDGVRKFREGDWIGSISSFAATGMMILIIIFLIIVFTSDTCTEKSFTVTMGVLMLVAWIIITGCETYRYFRPFRLN